MSATGINLHGVKTPMDFKKLLGGGAVEATRGVLAYQLAILKQIEFANNCAISPFVIDTPNQHEQAAENYQSSEKQSFISISSDLVWYGSYCLR